RPWSRGCVSPTWCPTQCVTTSVAWPKPAVKKTKPHRMIQLRIKPEMSRRRRFKGRDVHGILLLDKPTGLTSNDVLQKVKRIYNAAKADHTGALDPLATGMLPICLGEATKFSQYLLEADKRYEVTAKLGERTNTSDSDGEVVSTRPVNVALGTLIESLDQFRGPIMQ